MLRKGGGLIQRQVEIYTPSTTVKYQKSVSRACYDCKLKLEPNKLYSINCQIYTMPKHGDVTNILKAVEDGINLYAKMVNMDWDDKQICAFGVDLHEVSHKDEEKVIFILKVLGAE